MKKIQKLVKRLRDYYFRFMRNHYGRKYELGDSILWCSRYEYGSDRSMEMLLRQIISEMGIQSRYNDALYSIMIEYMQCLTELQRSYGIALSEPLEVFLNKHKNVGRETLVKFINEEKFPDKYSSDMGILYKSIYEIKTSKVVTVPCFHRGELELLPLGLGDLILRHGLYCDDRKRRFDDRKRVRLVYKEKVRNNETIKE